jgi:[ribosomal protein S5]-alanine N-acetyltransferase
VIIDGDRLPTIEAPRVRLRWLTDRDVDALHRVFSDPRVMRYWLTPPFPDRSAAVGYLGRIREGFASQELFQWGVARREDDAVIGTCTIFRIDPPHRRAELGYALAHDHWRQGLMSEALRALFRFAFDSLGLHRLEADVDPRNAASIALLARLGFEQEGLLRQRWQVSGEIQDALFFGLLAPEWRELERQRASKLPA